MPVTEYVWDDVNDCVMEETDGDGNTIVEYTHEPGGSLVSEYRDGTTYMHHYDALGSTTMLTDDTGTVTDTFAYDAWGNQTHRTGVTPTRYTWVGQWGYQDDTAITGEYYVRERQYRPSVARWTSADPILFFDGSNLFLYCSDTPQMNIDRRGTDSCDAKCLRPEKVGWTTHYAGPRGLSMQGQIKFFNLHPPLWSQLHILAYLSDGNQSNAWWEPGNPPPDPGTRKCCVCCCDTVSWLQVVEDTFQGSQAAMNYAKLLPDFSNQVQSTIDAGIPYPGGSSFSPCSQNRPRPSRDPNKWYSFEDAPGWKSVGRFFDLGGTEFRQNFETCLFCASGVEQYSTTPDFLVTYCCFSWGHAMYYQGNVRKISRNLGARTEIWNYSDELNQNNVGKHLLELTSQCQAPSDEFKAAIKAGVVLHPPKT